MGVVVSSASLASVKTRATRVPRSTGVPGGGPGSHPGGRIFAKLLVFNDEGEGGAFLPLGLHLDSVVPSKSEFPCELLGLVQTDTSPGLIYIFRGVQR